VVRQLVLCQEKHLELKVKRFHS